MLPNNEPGATKTPGRDLMSTMPLLSLSYKVPNDPGFREELLEGLKKIASQAFTTYSDAFTNALTPFERDVYAWVAKAHPYSPKDWYRDPHDIIVVSAMQHLVASEGLPSWLITAAILHDRGYAILASNDDQTARDYQRRAGAHWESIDTRLLHSRMSAELGRECVLKKFRGAAQKILPPLDTETFLTIIEKHDHPLIGKYEELPPVGRHHFDADSLFSISLLSFVKDWLSYCADEKKLDKARGAGICEMGEVLSPNGLLQARVARYYKEDSDLPDGWNLIETPLNSRALSFTEGGRCYPPHSPTALRWTDTFFQDLAKCCALLAECGSITEFLTNVEPMITAQFDLLLDF